VTVLETNENLTQAQIAGGGDGTAATDSNSGLPGHTLEYRIEYLNNGTGDIDQLVVNDIAPAFTTVLGASVACDATPASLSCTPSVSGDVLRWDFVGSLTAGATGSVVYRVTID